MIKIKILILADLHGVNHNNWEVLMNLDNSLFDIIATVGDISGFYLRKITDNFLDKKSIGISGNHDTKGALNLYGPEDIHNKIININGVDILGLEGSVRYKKSNTAPLYNQMEMINICNRLEYADIVISHNSPFGIHDRDDIPHKGFQGLRNYIEKHSPKYCIHGHQHINERTTYIKTEIIGVYGASIFNTKDGEIEKIF